MSFGDELRRERELREISLREVAEATKVNIRYLEAMERDDFEHLPGGVFNRGFVRAYAQYIGVDPEAMVNSYLLEERAQLARTVEPPSGGPSGVLRGTGRAPARAVIEPPRIRHRGDRAVGRSLIHLGLVALAAAILVGVGYLVWDVLHDRPGPLPAGRWSGEPPSERDG
jgi:cytoskeletal protein RodZ